MTRARPTRYRRQRGAALLFTLVLIAIVVVGSSVAFFGGINNSSIARDESTDKALQQAKEALLGYALSYRDKHPGDVFGYFPCPGDPDSANPGDAQLNCNATGRGSVGLLPYRTLGLPDLRDAQGNCLWYAVSGAFKESAKGGPDLPLNWDTQGQFQVLAADGSTIVQPDDAQGGAAVVIFSPGAPLAGQNRAASANEPCRVDATITRYLDLAYLNNPAAVITPQLNFATQQTPPNLPVTVQQGPVRDGAGNLTNNDILAWITPRELFDKIVVRNDFSGTGGLTNTALSDVASIVESRIHVDIDNGGAATTSKPYLRTATCPDPPPATDPCPTHWVGEVPDYPTATPTPPGEPETYVGNVLLPGNDQNVLLNWDENIRLATCKTLPGVGAGSGCLTINGNSCRAGVFFSGRTLGGQPRLQAQHPATPGNLPFYFEASSGAQALLKGSATTFESNLDVPPTKGKSIYYDHPADNPSKTLQENLAEYLANRPALRAADVGVCVMPSTVSYISLPGSPGKFAPGIVATSSDKPETTLSIANATITLGDPGSSSAGSGCAWFPDAVAFSQSLRAYFRIQIKDRGEGLTFAIADASTNAAPAAHVPPQIMCGGSSYFLGYAGSPDAASPTTQGIVPPKLGLEIDTRRDYSSSPELASNRNDPSPSSSLDHFALVYWGTAGDNALVSDKGADDNKHGVGTDSGTDPRNEVVSDRTSPSGIATVKSAEYPYLKFAGQLPFYPVPVERITYDGSSLFTLETAPTGSPSTPSRHNFAIGQRVVVSGASLASFNGTFDVESIPDRYSVVLSPISGPASLPIAGTNAVGGTVKPDTWVVPDNSDNARHGVIHVRLDIRKTYDPSTRTGRYEMTAYAGDHPSAEGSSCQVDLFRNLAKDLADICPLERPLLKDDITIRDPGGPVTISWSDSSGAGIATATTATPHGLRPGDSVTVETPSTATPSFNGTFGGIATPNATTFSYPLAAEPPGPVTTTGSFVGPTRMRSVYLGFTNGQGTTDARKQEVVISNFRARIE